MEPLELFSRRQVLTVSQLVKQVKTLAEERFDFVWVEGEIAGLRRPASGHLYFSLKDQEAALRAVLFRRQASLLRFRLEDGAQVLCQGRLSVYAPRGDLQLVVDTVEPRGAGALALAFEQIKRRLQAEGLTDPERKRPLPGLPRRLALVTSPSGAALRDFLKVLHRRFAGVEVAVYPVQVQGEAAPGRMIQALEDLARWGWPQVIVLTRGGGSPQDLWAFNHEGLARAIAACPIPVVSAVGHEIDFTISDLVADLRAPTPSAAAEMLVQNQAELLRRLASLDQRLGRAGRVMLERRRDRVEMARRGLSDPRRRLADMRLDLDDLVSRGERSLRRRLRREEQHLAVLGSRLVLCRPDRRLSAQRSRLEHLQGRLQGAGRELVQERRSRLQRLQAGLEALGPLSVLGRGYALVSDQSGRIVRHSGQVRRKQLLEVRLARGRLQTRVEDVLE